MAGGVIDGQAVSQAVTNPAFIFKNADDIMPNQLGMSHAPSGTTLISSQKAINSALDTTGATETVPGTNYGAPTNTILDGDNHQTALLKLANKYRGGVGLGHDHSGVDGQSEKVAAYNIKSVPLKGFVIQGVDQTGVSGSSTDVSTDMTGKVPSSGATVEGVVVTAPQNKLILRQASGASEDDSFFDGSGNLVYGRLTESSGVWTVSYFVNLAGVETPYSFPSPVDVRWYYQELYNPLLNPPVYSEFAAIPSDNATADVIQATTSEYGKVLLSSTSPVAIGASPITGSGTGTVSNEGHTHAGVHSVAKNGSAQILGDATFSEGANVHLTQVGNDIEIAADSLVYRAGKMAIPNSATSVAVVYSSAFPSDIAPSDIAVNATMSNPSDADPLFQPLELTSYSSSGFTAKWNMAVDSANYELHYNAVEAK